MNNGILGFPELVKTERRFYAAGAEGAPSATKNWVQYQKPQQAQFINFYVVGSGAGGGNGHSAAAGNARGGGGGGGSGGIVRATFLASMLPDVIWLQVPRGGSAGVAGGRALVALRPTANAQDWFLVSSNANAGAGGNGTGSAAGAAGAAGTIATLASAYLSSLAIDWTAQAGVAGIIGGAQTGANGGNITPTTTISGGASGAGTTSADFTGGSVVASICPTQAGGTGTGAGVNGFSEYKGLLVSTGGSGGGASNSSTGGNGGNGGQYGSGGGGGGGGTTGGTGGRGGDGIIIISSW